MEVKIEVVKREVIKPASPSPKDRLELSRLDINCPGFYVSTIFFYKTEDLATVSYTDIISAKLKSSLSETLSRFYPLAGRIEGVSINCNDEGVVFTEAHTDLLLPDFLRDINTDSLEVFCKTNPGDSPTEWPLLRVNITFFGSGTGVAVSVSASHKICDASSLLTFVTEFAATNAKGKSNDRNNIQFAETTIFPPPPSLISSQSPSKDYNIANSTGKCVINRFVFESSRIHDLKRKAASQSVDSPTRVEAISALIWRCARNASRSNFMVPRSMLMFHLMDLRLRIPSTILSPDAIGNLQAALLLKKCAESNLEICETVASFRKAKETANNMINENLKGNTLGQYLLGVYRNLGSEITQDIELYTMSSWCRKPFYEVDFGWGSPVWIGSALPKHNKMIVWLVDTKDGDGVEAWIGLPEQDMPLLLRDQEFLTYAALNPPVMIYT